MSDRKYPFTHQIEVALIDATPDNARGSFNKNGKIDTASEKFKSLVESVRVNGVVVPIMVRTNPSNPARYILIGGERRVLATKAAKLATILATEYGDISVEEAANKTTLENQEREDLTPLEQGKQYKIIVDYNGGSIEKTAQEHGKSPRWIAMRLSLLNLSDKFKKALSEQSDKLNVVQQMDILSLCNVSRYPVEIQDEVLAQLQRSQGWTYSAKRFEEFLGQNLEHKLGAAPWDKNDDKLVAKAGSCSVCHKRSSCRRLLFSEQVDDDKKAIQKDKCLDSFCWESKLDAWSVLAWTKAKVDNPDLVAGLGTYVPDGEQRQSLAKLFGNVLIPRHELSECKPGTKGSRPIFIVSGPNRGRIVSCLFSGDAAKKYTVKSGKTTKGQNPSEEVAKPKTLEEKKKELAARRLCHAIDLLRQKIEKDYADEAPKALNVNDLSIMASLIGAGPVDEMVSESKDVFELAKNADMKTVRIELWKKVACVLSKRLRYYGSKCNVSTAFCHEFDGCCKLIGIKPEDLLDEAAKEIPEPKSWSKES